MGGAGVRPGASLPNPEALSSAGFSRPSPENVPRQRGALGVGTRGQRGPQMVEASGRWRGAPADGGGPGGSLGLSVWGMPGASPRGFSDRGSLPSPANLQASLPLQGLNHSPPLPFPKVPSAATLTCSLGFPSLPGSPRTVPGHCWAGRGRPPVPWWLNVPCPIWGVSQVGGDVEI